MGILTSTLYPKFKIIKEAVEGQEYPKILLVGKIGSAEEENGNGRNYELRTLVEKIFEARTNPKALSAHPLFGEGTHPSDDLTGEITPDKITHRINKTDIVGNDMIGEIELIPETPLGKIMCVLVDKYGAVPGISSRAFGKMSGNYVDHESYRYVTHDLTFNPSTPNAFLKKAFTESVEIQKILKEATTPQLQVINESLHLNDEAEAEKAKKEKELADKLLLETKQKEALIMENLEKMTKEISEQASQIGSLKTELTSVKEDKAKLELQIKALQESQNKVTGHYEKSLAVLEGLMIKYHNVTNETRNIKGNYSKSLAIAEGLKKELFKVAENYGKALRVIQGLQAGTVKEAVAKYVDSELGEGSYEKYKVLFEGKSAKVAKEVIKSLKEVAGDSPARPILRKTSEPGAPLKESTSATKLDDEGERRVGLYS